MRSFDAAVSLQGTGRIEPSMPSDPHRHPSGDSPAEPPGAPTPRSSDVMARLTLSALERARAEPELWRQPVVHRALLVSGLTLLVSSLARLQADLGGGQSRG